MTNKCATTHARWSAFAKATGGNYTQGSAITGGYKVVVPVGLWQVVFSNFYALSCDMPDMLMIGANYIQGSDFAFTINRASLFTRFGKLVGMQDIEVGDARFDGDFVVRANDEYMAKQLLASDQLRDLLLQEKLVHLTVTRRGGLLARNNDPELAQLYFQIRDLAYDEDHLTALLEIFKVTLEQLCQIGAAIRTDPEEHFEPPTSAEVLQASSDAEQPKNEQPRAAQ